MRDMRLADCAIMTANSRASAMASVVADACGDDDARELAVARVSIASHSNGAKDVTCRRGARRS